MCDYSKSTPSFNNMQEKKKKGIVHMSLDELYKAVEQYKSQVFFGRNKYAEWDREGSVGGKDKIFIWENQ